MVITPSALTAGDNTPESWRCFDCDVNTHPGAPNKTDMLAGIAGGVFVLHTPNQEVYTVYDKVWRKAGSAPGCFCIGCLENRLGRAFRPKDFVPRDGLNILQGSTRLRDGRGF